MEITLASMDGKLNLLLSGRIASESIDPASTPGIEALIPFPPGLQLPQDMQLESVDEAIRAIFSEFEDTPEITGNRPAPVTLKSTCVQTDALLQDLMLEFLEAKVDEMSLMPIMVSHGTQILQTADKGCSASTTTLWSEQNESAFPASKALSYTDAEAHCRLSKTYKSLKSSKAKQDFMREKNEAARLGPETARRFLADVEDWRP